MSSVVSGKVGRIVLISLFEEEEVEEKKNFRNHIWLQTLSHNGLGAGCIFHLLSLSFPLE